MFRVRRLLAPVAAALALAATTVALPPAHAAGVRVYPLGDSITWGTTWRAQKPGAVPAGDPSYLLPFPGGYRFPLTTRLTASGLTHELVGTSTENSNPALDALGQNRHNGHRGYRVDEIAAALDGRSGNRDVSDLGGYWLTGAAPVDPDVTIVHLGTNDIGQRYDPGYTYPSGLANLDRPAQRAIFVQHLADRLQALVDKIQTLAPESAIVLSTILPVTVEPLGVTAVEYNVHVRRIAQAERDGGARVVLADAFRAFTREAPTGQTVVVPGLIAPDNAHPTPAGYVLLAGVYHDAVLAAAAML